MQQGLSHRDALVGDGSCDGLNESAERESCVRKHECIVECGADNATLKVMCLDLTNATSDVETECDQTFTCVQACMSGTGCPHRPGPSNLEFLNKHYLPFMITACVFVLFLLVWAGTKLWQRLQQRRIRRQEEIDTGQTLGAAVGRYFLPSHSVNAHQFRGMSPGGPAVAIRFEELGLQLKDGRTVLDGVTGDFKAGTMSAVMGPSGCGKTTFMNVLSGRATYGVRTGKVWFSDAEVNPIELRPSFGFVPQDDIVHSRLTVRENLHFAAQLRNPSSTSAAEIDDIVNDALTILQISHIQSSLVGSEAERGVSGGQKKRVNIGMELVANPSLLFLDEPTSGLDATTSLQVINSLRKMAELDMTIIMVIHQPRYSLFTLFDDVLLLGPGGRTVYLGNSQSAKTYFEGLGFQLPASENPADWIFDVLMGAISHPSIKDFKPAMLVEKWRENSSKVVQQVPRRQTDESENYMIAEAALREEWFKVDLDGSGYLDKAELMVLLERCGVTRPDENGVDELFHRISSREGPNDTERILFHDLLVYVVSTTRTIALDSAASASRLLKKPSETADDALLPASATGGARSAAIRQPGVLKQFLVLLARRFVQFFRENRQRSIDLALVASFAVILGKLHQGQNTDNLKFAGSLLLLHMSLSLMVCTSVLKVFGEGQVVFWRESGGGLNILAYMLAKVCGNMFDLLMQCMLFTIVYYFVKKPEQYFLSYFVPNMFVTLLAASWGYFLSSILPPQNATIAAVALMLVLCGVLGTTGEIPNRLTGGVMEIVVSVSITRWSVAMTLADEMGLSHEHAECAHPYGDALADAYGNAAIVPLPPDGIEWMTNIGRVWHNSMIVMSLWSVLLLCGTYLGLRFLNRDKQV